MSSDDLVVAVDGGGVKTDVALLNASGDLLAFVRGGASQAHHLGIDGSAEVVEGLVLRALEAAGVPERGRPLAATAQVLLAGADLPEEQVVLRRRIEQIGLSERLVVDNDTLALLRAGTDRGWGVAIVCGGGINCLGRAPDGREVRFPSLGAISGDWGGGGEVGLAALYAAARSEDGRGPRTALEAAVPEHFGLRTPFDVSCAVHLEDVPAARLGELTPVVFELHESDEVAAGIVRRLGEEVVAFARAVIGRLELAGADPDVVLGGSLLRTLPVDVVAFVESELAGLSPRARLVISPSVPIVGAALLGLDDLGAGPAAHDRARVQLDAAVEAWGRRAGRAA